MNHDVLPFFHIAHLYIENECFGLPFVPEIDGFLNFAIERYLEMCAQVFLDKRINRCIIAGVEDIEFRPGQVVAQGKIKMVNEDAHHDLQGLVPFVELNFSDRHMDRMEVENHDQGLNESTQHSKQRHMLKKLSL